LNPGHPLLLPAEWSREKLLAKGVKEWAEKPIYGREGGGISLHKQGGVIAQGKGEGESPTMIYQERAKMFQARDQHFVWGMWMVGDQCCGLSARGDASPITGNMSRFFPHRIV
jgi:glutathionylspermidine synthase